MKFLVGIAFAALMTSVASASEVTMPRFDVSSNQSPDSMFIPIPDDANTLVGFGANCMSSEIDAYSEKHELRPVFVGSIEGANNMNVGLFYDNERKLRIMISDVVNKKFCVLTVLKKIILFDETGRPIQSREAGN